MAAPDADARLAPLLGNAAFDPLREDPRFAKVKARADDLAAKPK